MPVSEPSSTFSTELASCENPPSPAPAPNEESSCPTPLAWRSVLNQFRSDSEPFVVERDKSRLYCRSWGAGPPLYLLNGFGGTSDLFALIAFLLRDDFRCVLMDEYSFDEPGRVEVPTQTPTGRVADLFAVADHCGDDTLSIFGTGLGGALGLVAMQTRPERIKQAVLQGAFARRRLTVAERLLAAVCRRSPGQVRHLPLRTVIQQQNHRPWFPPFDGTRWKFLLDNTGAVPLRLSALRGVVAGKIDLQSELSNISQPVLIIQTEGEGRVAAACHADLNAQLPHAQTVWLDNTGQLPFLTHPHRLAKIIRPFLRGEPLPATAEKPPDH